MGSPPPSRSPAEPSSPVIGITCVTLAGPHMRGGTHDAVPRDYADCVVHAGGVPVLLPNVPPRAAAALLAGLDGLILAGGWDIDPATYGREPEAKLGLVEQERDRLEVALVRAAYEAGMPIFAICRGVQMLNVARGGTLMQHIPASVANALRHEQKDVAPDALSHHVDIVAGTRLHELARATRARVNSFHHQAVDVVADGFVVSARAPDGVIEGIEDPGQPFCLGVQWHPERAPRDPLSRVLFEHFVQAARRARVEPRAADGVSAPRGW